MLVLTSLFKVLLPMMYLVVWGLYLWLFYTDHPNPRRWCTRAAASTVLVHLGVLGLRAWELGRLPMGNNLEFFSALALATLTTYLVIELRLKAKNTGFLVTGVAFIFEFTADAFVGTQAAVNPLLMDPGFAGHAILVLFSYTALSLSFMYALLYLLQARQLMNRQFGLMFRRLPSLETLERMSIGAVKLAVPLMLGALVLGHLWMYDLKARLPEALASELTPFDPKVLITWVIFLAYSVGLLGNRFLGWRGRRMNILAVIAFVVTFSAMGMVHHFFPTFHKFHGYVTNLEAPAQSAPVLALTTDPEVSK